MNGALGRLGNRLSRSARDPGGGAGAEPSTEPVPPLSGYDPDAGLPFDPARLERRIVWIWGSPRSGSTWLLRMLCHPLIPDPESTTIFRLPEDARGGRAAAAVPVDESFLSNHLSPALADPREIDGAYIPGTINNYLQARPVYAYSRAYREVWAPEARRFALVRLYGFLERARSEGVELEPDPLLVIKEVNGSHAAELVMSLMPTSRLLFLVRDGRDVVDSLLHAYSPGGFLAQEQGHEFATASERAEGLRWAARLWACNVDVTMRAIDSHPPELSRTVRYEDLLEGVGIAELGDWLGLKLRLPAGAGASAARATRSPTPRDRAAPPGAWRENLSAEEQGICTEMMGSRLERLGYKID